MGTPVLTAELLTAARVQRHGAPSPGCLRRMQRDVIQPFQSKILPFATAWVDLEGTVPNGICQMERDKTAGSVTCGF